MASLFSLVHESIREVGRTAFGADPPVELTIPDDYDDLKTLYYSQVEANAAMKERLLKMEREMEKSKKDTIVHPMRIQVEALYIPPEPQDVRDPLDNFLQDVMGSFHSFYAQPLNAECRVEYLVQSGEESCGKYEDQYEEGEAVYGESPPTCPEPTPTGFSQ